jgi:hypothetical protein
LTTDQIAIYRVILKEYANDPEGALNLANRTEPLHMDSSFKPACSTAIDPVSGKKAALDLHQIGPEVTQNLKFKLVDPGKQQRLIDQGDPQNLVRRGINGGEVSDKELGDSVKQAFAHGMIWLSEIAFDKQHHKAVVSFAFVCGGLCGNGKIALFELINGKWKEIDTCQEWVS